MPIRVTHLVSTLNIGGLEMVVYDLCRLADRERIDVRVLCLGEVGALGERFAGAGIPTLGLDVLSHGFRRSVLATTRALRSLKPDILHTHNPTPHLRGVLAARLAGVPRVVHTKHGRNYTNRRKSVYLNRVAAMGTDRLVAVSEDAADVACRIERVPASKVVRIYNGIDLERFRMPDPAIPARSPFRAIHVARLNRIKDQETLLRAARLVVDRAPEFRLTIVGDGEMRGRLEALRTELGLEAAVDLSGFRDDVHSLLAESGLFVLSSLSEGISLTLLEAMATGLPLVATRVGGNPEVVEDGHTGLLVPPRQPEALAHAILRLIDDPRRAAAMGLAGRGRVERLFDLRGTVNRYESLYGEAVESTSNRRARLAVG